MNNGNGMLVSPQAFNEMPEAEKKGYVEVKRDLTKLEAANMQIKLYSPCGCGSGKKFKFCCHKKPSAVSA
jgi:uncharacterized protein YchJ